MTDCIQIQTTVETREQASALARALVERRLVACVQVLGPVESTYRWQGKIETAQEWLCLAKGRREAYPAIEAAIRAVHPYEVPEILATAVAAGSAAYLEWLAQEAGGAGG